MDTNRPMQKPSASFEELAQNGARRESVPWPSGGARRTLCAFEYFLYAAIIVETALAAFVYKIIFRDPDLARFNVYFGIFYFAFLAWSLVQLNRAHRRRKLAQAEPTAAPTPAPVPEHARSALGLTIPQLAIVVVVFATAVVAFSWALKLLR
jgi:hypothetical protein